jgi:alpha-L-rhamnosidase
MQHEYMEFRYAEISGDLPEPPTTDSVRAWVVRYPLSDKPGDQYGDEPMLAVSSLRPVAEMATFASSNSSLDAVWGLVRYTLVAVSLDVNTDSNTRQRDLCHTDAYITSLGQMALSNNYGVQQMTAEDGFQLDSNIWQGTTDFRSALVSLAYEQALYTGDLRLVAQRYDDLKMHSFVYFFNRDVGLVVKGSGTMGGSGCKCPASWSPAGMPPGIYEALNCKCEDLVDWPSGSRDGYVSAGNNASAVANSYIALAAERMSVVAGWLGKTDDASMFGSIASTIKTNLREKLYNTATGSFVDGLGIAHSSMHATLFPAMAGAVNETAAPGMGAAVVKTLREKGMKCSCMAAYWLLEGLYRMGTHTADAADLALEILTSTDTNSWLNMIKQGATATMEAWTTSEKGNASWSHPWCSGPNSVIIRLLLGVRPTEPGWKRFDFVPQPSSLEWINATVPSKLGTIPVTLKQTPTAITTSLHVPEGGTARVCLPPPHAAASAEQATEQQLLVDGAAVASVVEGRMLCAKTDLAAGLHTIERSS